MAYVFSAVVGPLILPHQFPEASTVAAELFSSPAVVLPVKLLLWMAPTFVAAASTTTPIGFSEIKFWLTVAPPAASVK